MNSKCSRNASLSKLIRSLLNFKLLMRSKFGVSWQKSQLSIHFILYTFGRSTFLKRSIVIIVNLYVILASANVASISSNDDFWFDLTGANYNGFTRNQWANFIRLELTDRMNMNFGPRSINNNNIAKLKNCLLVFMGGNGDSFFIA